MSNAGLQVDPQTKRSMIIVDGETFHLLPRLVATPNEQVIVHQRTGKQAIIKRDEALMGLYPMPRNPAAIERAIRILYRGVNLAALPDRLSP